MYPSSTQSSNERAVRLVDYLLRLASLRTKLIRDIDDYEKVLWLSDIPDERGCFTQAWGRNEEYESDVWLEVQNRPEPELPATPAQCNGWVHPSGLRNKNDVPELLSEITREIQDPNWREGSENPKIIPKKERLDEHPEVLRAWERYLEERWLPWVEEHNAWEKIHNVYSKLFAIRQEQLRFGEEYELVLGLGLLTWQTPNGQRVRRHVVVANAILEFEPKLGKFTVRPHNEGAKLRPELDMLEIEEQPAGAEEKAKEWLAAAQDDPWDKECTEGVLKALVHLINPQGHYDESLEVRGVPASAKPIVKYAPALILRKRATKGLTETLKLMRDQIATGGPIPVEFAELAEIHLGDRGESLNGHASVNRRFDGEVFFPKPANDEQRRIVQMLESTSGVLVQGPPGTGKSHTIANLICHLLATGQRTLITAKTPRALQVLERLVPEELRPLCINLLGAGLEERQSLESSVSGILRKCEEWNEEGAKRERTDVKQRLRELRTESVEINRRLRNIRESETHTQSIAEGAYRGTAARIAEAVNRDRVHYEWFTDSVPVDKTCPITSGKLRRLLEELRQFTPDKRCELGRKWPQSLPSLERFTELVDIETSAANEEHSWGHVADQYIVDLLARNNPSVIEAIREALSNFREARGKLVAKSQSWIHDALRHILAGDSSVWRERLKVTRDVIASIEQLVSLADDTNIQCPDTTDVKRLFNDVCRLKEHIESGGRMGWWIFRPSR